MKIREYIQVKAAGGESPDPAVYCPLNGYILNPINPDDGWFLIAEFQTNSPSSATFDPTITASSGQYAWDLGDGTISMYDKAISHTYADSSTKTVRLYGNGTCVITGIAFDSDNIVGELDLSNDCFIAITGNISLNTNANLTSVIFPDTNTGTISTIGIYSTGITGTLDLSMFTSFTSSATISLYSNASMTGVTFAASVTGTVQQLSIYSTGISGTLDLSMFTAFISGALIYVYSNASMTGLTFASSVTGTFNNIFIYSTGITGTLDLSMFTTFSATAQVYLNTNASMTGVTFPASTITGFVRTLRLYSNTALGYVNLSTLRTGVASLNWDMKANGWSAAIVNQVLAEIDGISASGFASRVINIGGTNTDPDTTSGGYDGTAARTSLIAKSFTVTIT